MKKVQRSLWFYLSTFIVAYALMQTATNILVFHYGIKSALSVLAELGVPVLIVAGLYVHKEKKAPAGSQYWALFVGSLTCSIPISMVAKNIVLTGSVAGDLAGPFQAMQYNAMGLLFIIDLVIRALAFGLGYGFCARFIFDAMQKTRDTT
ncbi:ABZJ_00895 family protein [Pseudovibrio sp. Tun.PSC04-5.I4]|uniref:ABZJ_00895 family protein n=1 Tax=Pseudovibrio sp. Tun.PSC04-5.I4 TaxID=1798213 RepID=UPI00089191D3|nr:ABZJ_00895 family protein [Pseudovibrio sp. Tun.PSC04-5.I4]SDQ86595.1 hypothetical protein SAMN04515695_1699 [Pseudovibrio sp. Tun.PSC04-5.I4]